MFVSKVVCLYVASKESLAKVLGRRAVGIMLKAVRRKEAKNISL